MTRFKPALWAWVGTVLVAASAVASARLAPIPWLDVSLATSPASLQWPALGLLVLCAALVHYFPIRSGLGGSSYRLTSIFAVVGALVLSPLPLTILAPLAFLPDLWLRWRHPRLLAGWLVNIAQVTLAVHAAAAWRTWADAQLPDTHLNLLVLLIAGAIFTLVHDALLGITVALDTRTPLARISQFTIPSLLNSGLLALLGIAIAGLWLARPDLLCLVPVVLVVTHRLTRTAHLAHLAQVDVKTGLHNFRRFEQALEDEVVRSVRLNRPLALLFIDLDHFKQVNDRHGHIIGDEILREIALLLSRSFRKGDVLARFGGEEFLALLPGTDSDVALEVAERIRGVVEAHDFSLDGGETLRCTVSVGVAICPTDGMTADALVRQADAAMYRAKRTRNAIARASALPPVPRLQAGVVAAITAAGTPAPAAASGPAPSRLAHAVVWGTIVAGALVLAASLAATYLAGVWISLLPFLVLAVIAELLKVNVYQDERQQKVSFSFAMAVSLAAVTAIPLAAPLVNLAGAVVHVLTARQRQWEKALFNLANPALAAGAASAVYVFFRPGDPAFGVWHLAAALVAVLAYTTVNSGTLSLVISLYSRRPYWTVIQESSWYGPAKIVLGLTGAFLGAVQAQQGLLGVVMFVVPLLVLRYSLSLYAKHAERTIDTLQAAKGEVERAHQEKEETLRELIETVALIIDARDNSVSGHSRRVAKYAVAIGKELGLPENELATLHTAGLFHDLGKVGIPEPILHKPAKLTESEYEVVKGHALIGERLLSRVPRLADVAHMIGEHHERFDGRGYPRGHHGQQISLGGRILMVADSFETMLADRPYSKARSLADATAELERCAGTQFDPEVVAATFRAIDALGGTFFTMPAEERPGDFGAADKILSQVFEQIGHAA